jgi:hypothetical protein
MRQRVTPSRRSRTAAASAVTQGFAVAATSIAVAGRCGVSVVLIKSKDTGRLLLLAWRSAGESTLGRIARRKEVTEQG